MGNSAGQGCKGHDKDARSDCRFQLVSEDAGQDQKQHHSAACADETADETDHYAADNRLGNLLPFGFSRLHFLRCHNRADDEFEADKQCHALRKTAHRSVRHEGGNEAADQCKDQHGNQHNQAVADVDVFVFLIRPRADTRGKHIRRKRNSDRLVRRHVQECDQHRGDNCRRRESREPCSKTGAEAGCDTYNQLCNGHIFFLSFCFFITIRFIQFSSLFLLCQTVFSESFLDSPTIIGFTITVTFYNRRFPYSWNAI